jgi:hypothetical protein
MYRPRSTLYCLWRNYIEVRSGNLQKLHCQKPRWFVASWIIRSNLRARLRDVETTLPRSSRQSISTSRTRMWLVHKQWGFKKVTSSWDHGLKIQKKVGELRDDTSAIRLVLTPSFRKHRSSPAKKINRLARSCIWRCHFSVGIWNGQNLNKVLESQLFASSWNRNQRCLSDIKLIPISAFFSFLFQNWPLFHCSKANRGLEIFTQLTDTGKRPSSHLQSMLKGSLSATA